jgi:predicted ATPase
MATKGYAAPEVEQTYTRAQHLCQHLEDPRQLFPVLRGLWNYHAVRHEYQTACALAEQLLALAQQVQDPGMLLVACHTLGTTLFWLGAADSALTHLMQGMALYDPQQHRAAALLYGQDAGVACRSRAAWVLWCLGYPDQGRTRIQEAIALAQQIAHPFSLGYALTSAALFHQCCGEWWVAQEHAAAAISLATEQGFPLWQAHGTGLHGWALVRQGRAQEGLEQIRQILANSTTGVGELRSYFLALLAAVHGSMGQPEAGLMALAEALTLAGTTRVRWYEPELYRLKGELLLQQSADNYTEAYACFQQALSVARVQQARSFELRAATSLARLWQQQGKRAEAYQLLAEVYGWFTEGFDTADLQEARALLDALAP